MKISKYLDPKCLLFFEVKNREEAIQSLVSHLNSCGKLKNEKAFFDAICSRERIVSTGIGMGVAIPHAKLSDYHDFFIAIGILKKGVDWNALDGIPVKLIFMIGGPEDRQTEYLKILSGLTVALKDETLRKKMLTLNSAHAIIRLFEAI